MSNIYTNKLFSCMAYYLYLDKMYAYKDRKYYEVKRYGRLYEYEEREKNQIPEKVLEIFKKIRNLTEVK